MAQRQIGRYQVLEEIASGGQATVYRVWDNEAGGVLALKVMHPHLVRDPAYLERFHREAHMAASINHPNVIQIYEVGHDGEAHYMAMEYLPISLHYLLQAQGKLPIDQAANIAYQVCLGLQSAHQHGIVHRDIKPQNILLAPDGTAKVTDFGIARATDLSTMTRTGVVMGTPHYMSPEQAKGLRSDIRSDIYSLGIALYQMLTGIVPFNADTPWEVVRLQIDAKPTPLRRRRPEVPRSLESVVDRCLDKDPGRRYQDPAEVARALEKALPGAISAPVRSHAAAAPPSPQPAPVALPRPSVTWINSLARALQRARPRRRAGAGVFPALALAMGALVVGLGFIDEIGDRLDSKSWWPAAAAVTAPPVSEATHAPMSEATGATLVSGPVVSATFPVGRDPHALASDGEAIWVANTNDDTVTRLAVSPNTPTIQASLGGDGALAAETAAHGDDG